MITKYIDLFTTWFHSLSHTYQVLVVFVAILVTFLVVSLLCHFLWYIVIAAVVALAYHGFWRK